MESQNSKLAFDPEHYVSIIADYSVSVIGAIVLLVAGVIVAGAARRWVYNALGKAGNFDETLRGFLARASRFAVLLLVGVTVLAQFGVQTTSIIAALGAAGLAIGLALQGTLQNIAAGIMLLVLRPFRVGEFIEAGGMSGTIVEIGLFATEIKTLDGLYLFAPNNELWNTPVKNYNRNPTRRNDLAIGIGYDDDIALAEKTLADLTASDGRVLDNPAPQTYVSDLGDSAVTVVARYWTEAPDWWQTKLDLTKAAKLAFDAKGISIPYPQQDVHIFERKTE
jgi:small conductance mechanosensitive channel